MCSSFEPPQLLFAKCVRRLAFASSGNNDTCNGRNVIGGLRLNKMEAQIYFIEIKLRATTLTSE